MGREVFLGYRNRVKGVEMSDGCRLSSVTNACVVLGIHPHFPFAFLLSSYMASVTLPLLLYLTRSTYDRRSPSPLSLVRTGSTKVSPSSKSPSPQFPNKPAGSWASPSAQRL